MSSLVQRNNEALNESEWLELSDGLGISPASIWTFDDEDDEITIQCKRVVLPQADPITEDDVNASVDEARKSNTTRPPRLLDESRVLPGEASFATVRLNQPIESMDSYGQERTAKLHTRFEVEVDRPVRVLDESYVPPGEALYVTAASNDRNHARSYSPLTEFFAKSNLKILGFIALSLFSVSAVTTLAVLKFKNDVVSSAPMVNDRREVSLPVAPQEETAVAHSASIESTGASQNQSEVGGTVASIVGDPAEAGEDLEVADKKLPSPTDSDEAPKKVSGQAVKSSNDDVKLNQPKARAVVQAQKEKPDTVQRQTQAKHVSRPVKRVAVERKDGKASRAGTVATGEPASLKESAAQTKNEIMNPPATGGGERPRTVTRRNP